MKRMVVASFIVAVIVAVVYLLTVPGWCESECEFTIYEAYQNPFAKGEDPLWSVEFKIGGGCRLYLNATRQQFGMKKSELDKLAKRLGVPFEKLEGVSFKSQHGNALEAVRELIGGVR